METVSSMLGHAILRTTQIYSKIKKKKVSNREKWGDSIVFCANTAHLFADELQNITKLPVS